MSNLEPRVCRECGHNEGVRENGFCKGWGAFWPCGCRCDFSPVSAPPKATETAQMDADAVERVLDELRWYGKTIGGGVPMIGTEKPGRTACTRWYKITLPLLYKLNAVYGPPERVGCGDCRGNGFRRDDSTCKTCKGLGMIAGNEEREND